MNEEEVRKGFCGTCKWWQEAGITRPDRGYCKRMPPTARTENSTGIWPLTFWREWCGEYE